MEPVLVIGRPRSLLLGRLLQALGSPASPFQFICFLMCSHVLFINMAGSERDPVCFQVGEDRSISHGRHGRTEQSCLCAKAGSLCLQQSLASECHALERGPRRLCGTPLCPASSCPHLVLFSLPPPSLLFSAGAAASSLILKNNSLLFLHIWAAFMGVQ